MEKIESEKEPFMEKVYSWIRRGRKYIYPQKLKEWKRCVAIRAGDIYNGAELDAALDVMEALNNGASFDEANQILESQGHSGESLSIVMSIILTFCKNGPEFYEAVTEYISEEDKQYIDEQKKLNSQYEKELNGEREL